MNHSSCVSGGGQGWESPELMLSDSLLSTISNSPTPVSAFSFPALGASPAKPNRLSAHDVLSLFNCGWQTTLFRSFKQCMLLAHRHTFEQQQAPQHDRQKSERTFFSHQHLAYGTK